MFGNSKSGGVVSQGKGRDKNLKEKGGFLFRKCSYLFQKLMNLTGGEKINIHKKVGSIYRVKVPISRGEGWGSYWNC
jgi:hypothetical protein